MAEYVAWYPWIQGFVVVFFLVVVWALKKEFASKKEVEDATKRLQTVEQTYVKTSDFEGVRDTVNKIESEFKGLPGEVATLTKEVTKLQGECSHLHELLKRIEHPLNLIVESKIKGTSDD
jgi:predicted RNase H-like nuclease (RuvC/YqgF family)